MSTACAGRSAWRLTRCTWWHWPASRKRLQRRAEALYAQLVDAGLEPLYDDRPESPGVKFNDADLIGCPLRLTLSERSLKAGGVEVKVRKSGEVSYHPLENLPAVLAEMLFKLK